MSLRARLLLVTVGLVAVGLLVAGAATFVFTRTFLQDQIDDQLAAAGPFVARALSQPAGFEPPSDQVALPPGTYAEYRSPDGTVVRWKSWGYGPQSRPELPAGLPVEAGAMHPTTVRVSGGSGGHYRVMATPTTDGGSLIVAIPLSEVTSTLRRLLRIEGLVGIAVLASVAALALWLVRLGLRPLEGIGATAGAIAAGDLSQRVTPAESRTEVGRLGLALNAMLARIEASFEERRASEERLRRFVADASHELRTPLTSIRGYAELFRRGAGSRPEDLQKSMTRIEAEAARMGVLVDDLLLLARLDQGRPLERDPVDLGAIVTEAADATRAVDPSRTIEVAVAGRIELIGDAGRLRQVVDNLLENVRVHAPGSHRVRIGVARSGDGVTMTVADDGPGVPEEVRTRVFERFYRADPARSRTTGGAGLGLSIVVAIVHAHGGRVSIDAPVEGSPGDQSGATFRVWLPAQPPVPPPPDASLSEPPSR